VCSFGIFRRGKEVGGSRVERPGTYLDTVKENEHNGFSWWRGDEHEE